MYIGSLNDTSLAEKMHPAFSKVFNYIRSHNIDDCTDKQIIIVPDKVYINNDNATMRDAENALLEIHRKYIDIHIPLSATEVIGWRHRDEICADVNYNADKDIAFYNSSIVPDSYITLHIGEFAIVYPEDAHAPIIGKGNIHKLCVKVALDAI